MPILCTGLNMVSCLTPLSKTDRKIERCKHRNKNNLICFGDSEAGSHEAEEGSPFEATQLHVAALVCVSVARLMGNGGLGAHCSLKNL